MGNRSTPAKASRLMTVNLPNNLELGDLAKAYCRKYSSTETANNMTDFEVYEKVCDLVKRNPEAAFNFILLAIKEKPSDFAFSNLAAGPMEDLLVFHGEQMIDLIEKEAKQNADFDDLLGGVWLGRMTPEIANRVTHARSAIWRD
jgi:hypothetical protein